MILSTLTVIGPKFAVSSVQVSVLTMFPSVDTLCSGNHYSLRAEHDKAIKYFKRATDLDRTYLSAWMLIGHEYVEMKNSHAAIEAYRRAIGKLLLIFVPMRLSQRHRCEQKGLSSLVRTRAGIRASQHASICTLLLPACHCPTVCYPNCRSRVTSLRFL